MRSSAESEGIENGPIQPGLDSEEQLDREPTAAETEETLSTIKPRRSFSRVTRELTEEELGTSGVQKLLVEEIDRLETEKGQLTDFRDLCHREQTRSAVLEEQRKTVLQTEVISATCFALGGILVGCAPGLWATAPYGHFVGLVGAVLTVMGIVAKAVRL